MIKFLCIILLMLSSILMMFKLYRDYRSSKNINFKSAFWIILIVVIIPILVFLVDSYDVISKWGWFENSSSDRWFSFFETYFSTIVSAVIAAVVLILMTNHQLEIEREKDLFDKRIQNQPVFRYEIGNLYKPTDIICSIVNKIDGNTYSLFLDIENLGLNHAKNVEFEVFDGCTKKGQKFKFDKQSFLKKDECKSLRFDFNYKYDFDNQKNNNKEIRLILRYDDLLNNSYEQVIKVYVEVTNVFGSQHGGYELFIVDIEINIEKHVGKKCIKC